MSLTHDVPSIEEEETTKDGPKKAISLRVAEADLALAKELAQELETGYQTLLNEVIHDGLADRAADLAYRRLVTRFRASLSELKAAQDLAESPAVKAAQELLASPAIKAAQDLLNAPAVKAAQEAAANPLQRAKDFRNSEEFAASPLGKAIKDLTASPAFQAAQELAANTGAKLQREWQKSPGGRLTSALKHAAEHPKADEVAELRKTVGELQAALAKAGLLHTEQPEQAEA